MWDKPFAFGLTIFTTVIFLLGASSIIAWYFFLAFISETISPAYKPWWKTNEKERVILNVCFNEIFLNVIWIAFVNSSIYFYKLNDNFRPKKFLFLSFVTFVSFNAFV